MTTYTVHKGVGDDRVVIALDGYGPPDNQGFADVGSFSHGVDEDDNTTSAEDLNKDGDHFLVAGAKKVLRESGDYGHLNLDRLTYLDQASNAEHHSDMAYSTETLADSGGEPHPEISTQLGGVGSEANDSEVPTTQNSETETVAEGTGAKETDGSTDGSEDADQDEDPADGETVAELKERIAGITDKDELQKAYDDEKNRGKSRSTALAAIEARAAELNEAE